ncbi:MAG: MotA/TolQ/ExbB proton channel family protein [Flaviramulus sp.]|nr:MotA/TolQ/ExbB proton channel family protein [Flaviramulus sp.]
MNFLSVFMSVFFMNIFMDGGPLFMSLILICLLLALSFVVMGFLNLKKDVSKSKKMTSLASDTSILGLVIGFLGSIIGMITGFDAIESMSDISSGMLAAGLKISFITTLFGSVTFILPRIGIIILKSLHKN